MKAKALLSAYRAYVKESGVHCSADEPNVAVVYGEDQFKLDFRRGIVKLAGEPNALEVPELKGWNNGPIPWVGAIVQYERHHLVMGSGDPWGLAGKLLLPNQRGVVRALPLLVALGAEPHA